MFQRLDQLRTGSLYILTGQAGAGKSHLAASARRSGTLYILDTEGAAQNLTGKPGIHAAIQALQTLSLRTLLDGMRAIKQLGTPGDTVILDSISKVLQAMRAYAQQRAGGDTDRKASLAYDEHASVNRNMQAIYTGLTELKHAGFHVIIIGHLAKKYQTNGSSLADVGLRVLADEHITYEADAVLLVERKGTTRTVTPIIKPPRPLHLQLNQDYPATIATLYPDQAEEQTVTITAEEAERRFYARYGEAIGGATWAAVVAFLGYDSQEPATAAEWIEIATEVKAKVEEQDKTPAPVRRTKTGQS
jgi:hypothetical protein